MKEIVDIIEKQGDLKDKSGKMNRKQRRMEVSKKRKLRAQKTSRKNNR